MAINKSVKAQEKKGRLPQERKKILSNDQTVLEHILQEWQKEVYQDEVDDPAGITPSEAFELFSADQILRKYDLDYDEIESGIVDGEHDGGIDSIYVLVNGKLISDEAIRHLPKSDVRIEVVVIQSKTDTGFNEGVMNNLITTAEELFGLQTNLDELENVYNDKLREIVGRFQEIYKHLASSFPELNFEYSYVTKAKTGEDASANVRRKAKALEKVLKEHFDKCTLDFQFLGARELYELARRSQRQPIPLKFAKGPLAETDGSCVVLVHLRDYYQFITYASNSERQLRLEIFESNVRDYEGDIDVNEDIHRTLVEPVQGEDFWWLNNGVTILTTEATSAGEQLTIRDPQIVNGLQTSVEIYRHFSNLPKKGRRKLAPDNRNILVRVIKCSDASRSKIIKATNYQTKIPIASLMATADPFQEMIEDYLKGQTYFYERRKNFYKNLKKPKRQIVSVTFLAQAVMAIVLQEPNNSRGRPSDLLRNKGAYERVFSRDYPLALFATCIQLTKRVDGFLRREAPLYVKGNESNIRFQLAMFTVMAKAGALTPSPSSIPKLELENVDSTFLKKCLKHV